MKCEVQTNRQNLIFYVSLAEASTLLGCRFVVSGGVIKDTHTHTHTHTHNAVFLILIDDLLTCKGSDTQ